MSFEEGGDRGVEGVIGFSFGEQGGAGEGAGVRGDW